MKRRLLLSFATLLVSAGLSHTAFADTFTFTLSNANQSGAPGSVLSYVGTLTNSGTTSVNLDGIEFNGTNFVSSTGGACSGTMLCFDEDPFINNAPLSLDAGGSYTGILFNIDIPLSASIGQFAGNVDIAGDAGPLGGTAGIVSFSTSVKAAAAVTPEPSTWLLMGTGVVGLFVMGRRDWFAREKML